MEINDIKIFYEVAKLRSTSKAANRLRYVQSNISKRIAKLEGEVGKSLFIRSNKGMELTTDGEVFLVYAEEILSTIFNMEKVFSMKKEIVRIGATQTISRNYLSKYYLRKDILFFTKSTNELIKLLENCLVDFLIINKKLINAEFKEVQSISESIYWVKSKENKNIFEKNKIIVSRDKECPYRLETFKYIEKNKITSMQIIEVDTLDILLELIETNEAVAILPKKNIDSNNKLELINNICCNEVKIYVYTLLSNNMMSINDMVEKNILLFNH